MLEENRLGEASIKVQQVKPPLASPTCPARMPVQVLAAL